MKTAIYNKVKRAVMLALLGVMMVPATQAQEALHLFFKDGNHEKIAVTDELEVKFVKQPYLEWVYYANANDTIYMSATSGRTNNIGRITANVPWTTSADAEWLFARRNIKSRFQYPRGDGMIEEPFLIFAEANKTDQIRTAKLTINTEHGVSDEIIVAQYPFELSLTPMDDVYGFESTTASDEVLPWDCTEYYPVAYPGFDVSVASYPQWMTLEVCKNTSDDFSLDEIKQLPDSIIVSHEQNLGLGDGYTYAHFTFEQNRSSEDRTGEIVFEGRGQKAVITVTQKGLTDAVMLESLEDLQDWMAKYGTVSTSHDDYSHMSVLHTTEMMSEDLIVYNNQSYAWDYMYANNTADYRRNSVNWETYYGMISRVNALIDLVAEVQEELGDTDFTLGNAYAYRAMAYLYLIQLFQDPTSAGGVSESIPGVPMIFAETEKAEMTAEQIEYFKGRNTVGEVFAQIEADITRAIELLEGKVRPTKNYIDITVAQGIAARYYLLAQDWEKAAVMANAARNAYRLMDGNTETNGIRDGFMSIANEEWMWGFDHTPETTSMYASFFSHASNLTPGYAGLGYTGRGVDARLLEQMTATDYRRAYWYRDADGNTESTAEASPNATTWSFPYAFLKFGWMEDWAQDYVYMRAAEMVLIEAEAQLQQGNASQAGNVLAELMERRDPNWKNDSPTLEDVYLQRRLELIGEGHAYFDLKRLNKGVERDYEGSNHLEGYKLNVGAGDTAWIYKIPQRAIDDDATYNLTEVDNNLSLQVPVYLQELGYSSYNNDTIFISSSAGRTNAYGWVQCNYPWTVTVDADWLMTRVNEDANYNSTFTGDFEYENYFMLYATANETDVERTAVLTISTEQDVERTFTVVQRPYTLSFYEAPYLNGMRFDGEPVDTFVIEGAWNWNNIYYNLLPNHGWEVTSYPDWLTMEEFVHEGDGFDFDEVFEAEDIFNIGRSVVSTVSFRFEPNESAEPRTGHVIIEGHGQKVVGIFNQQGLTEQGILNDAESLVKKMYQFGEVLGNGCHIDFGFPSLMLAMDSRGADLVANPLSQNWYLQSLSYSDLNSNYTSTALSWGTMYNQIQAANEVIGMYNNRSEDQLFQFYLGQAYALRAFNYFYLAQLYQQTYVGNEEQPCVPLIHEGNMQKVNAEGCHRSTVREVYDFILNDLAQALQLLQQSEMSRTNKGMIAPVVVFGLRARIYMVMNRWEEAAAEAQRVIAAAVASPYTRDEVSRPTFADINHRSWIWGIDVEENDSPVVSGVCNWPSHMGSFAYGYAQVGVWRKVSKSLYDAIPTTDVRKGWFLDENCASANLNDGQTDYAASYGMPAYTQVKFAPYNDELGTSVNANDIPLMRVEEMYLILAEAQAMLGNTAEAINTLNSFVTTYRDPDYNCSATTSEEVRDAVWMQRRIELWGEGHSYFDLMRMKKGVDRRGAGFEAGYVYNIPAGDAALILPIPDYAMNSNALLVQNPTAEQPMPEVEEGRFTRDMVLGDYHWIYTSRFSGSEMTMAVTIEADPDSETGVLMRNMLVEGTVIKGEFDFATGTLSFAGGQGLFLQESDNYLYAFETYDLTHVVFEFTEGGSMVASADRSESGVIWGVYVYDATTSEGVGWYDVAAGDVVLQKKESEEEAVFTRDMVLGDYHWTYTSRFSGSEMTMAVTIEADPDSETGVLMRNMLVEGTVIKGEFDFATGTLSFAGGQGLFLQESDNYLYAFETYDLTHVVFEFTEGGSMVASADRSESGVIWGVYVYDATTYEGVGWYDVAAGDVVLQRTSQNAVSRKVSVKTDSLQHVTLHAGMEPIYKK